MACFGKMKKHNVIPVIKPKRKPVPGGIVEIPPLPVEPGFPRYFNLTLFISGFTQDELTFSIQIRV